MDKRWRPFWLEILKNRRLRHHRAAPHQPLPQQVQHRLGQFRTFVEQLVEQGLKAVCMHGLSLPAHTSNVGTLQCAARATVAGPLSAMKRARRALMRSWHRGSAR